jgi:predicted nucleic acid-binding protein
MKAAATHSTTAINAFELYYGAYRSRRRDVNVNETRRILARLNVLPFKVESTREADDVENLSAEPLQIFS